MKQVYLYVASMNIRPLLSTDWPQVEAIYEEGLATRMATFETSSPGWEKWDRSHLTTCRLVAYEDEKILGWAALSPVSDRCVYGGVAEVSVYIAENARGKGIGMALLSQLIEESEKQNFWTLQSSMFPENTASRELHEKAGFRTIGTREKIGKLDGTWRDTLMMERRSPNIH